MDIFRDTDPEETQEWREADRKSTRLNSSHANISYAVFCLKKKSVTDALPVAPSRRLWPRCTFARLDRDAPGPRLNAGATTFPYPVLCRHTEVPEWFHKRTN